jgi:hypothetical protein
MPAFSGMAAARRYLGCEAAVARPADRGSSTVEFVIPHLASRIPQ